MEQFGPSILNPATSSIRFAVRAFNRRSVTLLLKTENGLSEYPMRREGEHRFSTTVEGMGLDLQYKYILDGEGPFSDPYAHFLPGGVHGFAAVVDHGAYSWRYRQWPGIQWERSVIYELHTGTFTDRGTFRDAAAKLDYLCELGVNTVELMPVNQTPGRWNWGYDGVNLFSVNCNYGTPGDLKIFVDSCHQRGLAVLLDMVYNHFGPEGCYLEKFGPYFTKRHETPWGAAVNYDDEGCQVVREMVLGSVRHWIENYHLDGLRLDAVHAIRDDGPRHILEEIAAEARRLSRELGRKIVIIAETDENDTRLIKRPGEGGYGMDAQWMDDFHHTVHTALTGENKGYYQDYGGLEGLEKVYRNYLYTGQYSRFWKKRRGTDASANPGEQFVVAVQTHDQVGNRAHGERLSYLAGYAHARAAAGLLLTSPYIPMLFMGEEYGEENPFLFFTDYHDPKLKKAVTEGRKKEFAQFGWDDIPDPEDDRTFHASILTPRERWEPKQEKLFSFYRDLIRLRREHPVLAVPDKKNLSINADPKTGFVHLVRWNNRLQVTALFNLGKGELPLDENPGRLLLDSEHPRYGGRSTGGKPSVLLPGHLLLFENISEGRFW